MELIKTYFLTLGVFLGIDSVWLLTMNKNFYGKYLGHLMAEKPNLLIAFGFYLINVVGMMILVINPALKDNSWNKLLIGAMVYGLCTYATYDMTNMATLKNWPTIVTIVDMIWGVTLTTAVSSVVFYILRK
jgi:uncharacterized membrane protein